MLKRQSSMRSLRNVARMVALGKGSRSPGHGFRKKRSPHMRWKMAIIAVVAFLRLQHRKFFLLPRELLRIRNIYDRAEGINSSTKLGLLLQLHGVQIPDNELQSLLELLKYREGHMLTFRQFRVFFQVKKLQGCLAKGVVPGSAEEAFKSIGSKPGQASAKHISVSKLHHLVDEFGLELDTGDKEELALDDFTQVVAATPGDLDWWRQPDSDEWWDNIDDWMHKPSQRPKRVSIKQAPPATLEEMLKMNLNMAAQGVLSPNRDSHAVAEESVAFSASHYSMVLAASSNLESQSALSPSSQGNASSSRPVPSPLGRDILRPLSHHEEDALADALDIHTPSVYPSSTNSPMRSRTPVKLSRPTTAGSSLSRSKAKRWEEFMGRMERDIDHRRSRPGTAMAGGCRPVDASTSHPRECFSDRVAPSPLWKEREVAPAEAPSIHQMPFSIGIVKQNDKFKMRRPQTAEPRQSPMPSSKLHSTSVMVPAAAHHTTADDIQPPSASACLSTWVQGGAHADKQRKFQGKK